MHISSLLHRRSSQSVRARILQSPIALPAVLVPQWAKTAGHRVQYSILNRALIADLILTLFTY